jgi:hypothetical protein
LGGIPCVSVLEDRGEIWLGIGCAPHQVVTTLALLSKLLDTISKMSACVIKLAVFRRHEDILCGVVSRNCGVNHVRDLPLIIVS